MNYFSNKKRGVTLIAAIIIMLIMSVLGLTLASMLGVTSRGSLDYLRSAQALGLAQAGLNWYMMRLAGIANWSSETNQTAVSLGAGTFDVTINSQTSNKINFTVTGNVTGTDGVTIKRTMTQSATKTIKGANFALFWGTDNGSVNFNNMTIIGDYWSRGTTSFEASSSITGGLAYRPDTEDITGAGSFTEFSVSSPYPSMPVLDLSYYTGLCSTYDAKITGSGTINWNEDHTLSGDIFTCQDFNTNTTAGSSVTISGYGYIIASRDMELNTAAGSGRTLTITPSGGNIVLIAARNITINTSGGTKTVNINSGTHIYCRNNGNSRLITINNDNTNIDGALILANRRLLVQNSANLTNSTLFVNYPGSTNNNRLRVLDSGTTVGTVASPCTLISIGQNATSLDIANNASVTGFVYQYDSSNNGSFDINNATVTGSVVANQLNTLSGSTITYDSSAIPANDNLDFVAKKDADSWSGT